MIEEAKRLPGLLGRIAPAMLAEHGEYRAIVGGVRTWCFLAAENTQREED